MQPVKIKIISTTCAEDAEPAVTEQKYAGLMTAKNGKQYVIYQEDAQSGLEGTKTTLKWDSERVVILRSGAVTHRQEFCRGLTDISLYQTPYLHIPLRTETHYLYTYFRAGSWHLEMEYNLYHGEDAYGMMKILIEIEEDTQLGH